VDGAKVDDEEGAVLAPPKANVEEVEENVNALELATEPASFGLANALDSGPGSDGLPNALEDSPEVKALDDGPAKALDDGPENALDDGPANALELGTAAAAVDSSAASEGENALPRLRLLFRPAATTTSSLRGEEAKAEELLSCASNPLELADAAAADGSARLLLDPLPPLPSALEAGPAADDDEAPNSARPRDAFLALPRPRRPCSSTSTSSSSSSSSSSLPRPAARLLRLASSSAAIFAARSACRRANSAFASSGDALMRRRARPATGTGASPPSMLGPPGTMGSEEGGVTDAASADLEDDVGTAALLLDNELAALLELLSGAPNAKLNAGAALDADDAEEEEVANAALVPKSITTGVGGGRCVRVRRAGSASSALATASSCADAVLTPIENAPPLPLPLDVAGVNEKLKDGALEEEDEDEEDDEENEKEEEEEAESEDADEADALLADDRAGLELLDSAPKLKDGAEETELLALLLADWKLNAGAVLTLLALEALLVDWKLNAGALLSLLEPLLATALLVPNANAGVEELLLVELTVALLVPNENAGADALLALLLLLVAPIDAKLNAGALLELTVLTLPLSELLVPKANAGVDAELLAAPLLLLELVALGPNEKDGIAEELSPLLLLSLLVLELTPKANDGAPPELLALLNWKAGALLLLLPLLTDDASLKLNGGGETTAAAGRVAGFVALAVASVLAGSPKSL
jgi:hypothetical protein